MQISVLVKPTSENRFRASSGDPLKLETEAPTREEALQKLRDLVQRRMKAGAQVVALEIGTAEHPLTPFAGVLKGDPLLESWKEALADYRTERERCGNAMTLYVLDTDILVLFQEGNEAVCRRICRHAVDELATTVITIEEQLSGWYTLVRRAKGPEQLARAYQRLADSVAFLTHFRILSFTEEAIQRYEQLQSQKLGTRKMDLRIAAITLENAGTLITRNMRNFQGIPGLAIENWAAEDPSW